MKVRWLFILLFILCHQLTATVDSNAEGEPLTPQDCDEYHDCKKPPKPTEMQNDEDEDDMFMYERCIGKFTTNHAPYPDDVVIDNSLGPLGFCGHYQEFDDENRKWGILECFWGFCRTGWHSAINLDKAPEQSFENGCLCLSCSHKIVRPQWHGQPIGFAIIGCFSCDNGRLHYR